jgi:hypothetical protein
MIKYYTIDDFIPVYKVSKFLKDEVKSTSDFENLIFVLDDKCQEKSYTVVDESENDFYS